MKTIAIVSFCRPEDGGIFQYAKSMINALALDSAHKYIIVTNKENNFFNSYGLEIRRITKSRASLYKKLIWTAMLIFGIRYRLFLDQETKEAFKDVELIFCPEIAFFPHFFLNIPYILTLHDMQERYYPEFFPWTERARRHFLNWVSSRNAEFMLCESNCIKADLEKYLGIESKRIFVIPSPPPKEFLAFDLSEDVTRSIKKKLKLPDKFIFYPAQFWPHKNQKRLIEAFKKVSDEVPDLKLVLTGKKPEKEIFESKLKKMAPTERLLRSRYWDYHDSVLRTIQTLGLNEKVIHLPYIDYRELCAVYKLSTALVMPTLFESVSMPIYEAFALRVPVACSRVVSLPEQVGEGALLFDPLDVDDMAEKISMIVNESQTAMALIEKGLARINNFNHQEYLKSLLNVVQSDT